VGDNLLETLVWLPEQIRSPPLMIASILCCRSGLKGFFGVAIVRLVASRVRLEVACWELRHAVHGSILDFVAKRIFAQLPFAFVWQLILLASSLPWARRLRPRWPGADGMNAFSNSRRQRKRLSRR